MKPAIEPILELREVARCILGAKGMIRAAKRALDVAQNRIDPMKLGVLRTGTPAARHHRVVGTPRLGHGMKTRQPITEHPAAFAQVLASPRGELDATEPVDDRELHPLRMAPVVGLDGGDDGGLSGCPATGLPAASLAAQVGVIELDAPGKRVLAVALHHHLHQLVLHAPGGVVGDAEMAMQLHRRDALLVLGHEVEGLEPHAQRQLGGIEDSACGHRGLAMAAMALLELAGGQLAAAVMATVRALESVRPSPSIQGGEALVLGSVECEKLAQADTFLELYRIARHVKSPFLVGELHGKWYK